MAIKVPTTISNLPGGMPFTTVARPSEFIKKISMTGLQPAAGDIVRLTPKFNTPVAKLRIGELHVRYDGAIQQGTDTKLVIVGQADNVVDITLADGAASDAASEQEFNDMQLKKAASNPVGDKLLWRELDAFYIGLHYVTAKSAAIAANKDLDIIVAYTAV